MSINLVYTNFLKFKMLINKENYFVVGFPYKLFSIDQAILIF